MPNCVQQNICKNQIEIKNDETLEISLIYSIKSKRPSIDLCGTQHDTCIWSDFEPAVLR